MAKMMQQINPVDVYPYSPGGDEPFGGGVTPEPVPTTQPSPGAGAAPAPMPKPTVERSVGPNTGATVGSASAVETPMPKPAPTVGGEIPMPKPSVGSGTAPAAPGVTPGGTSFGSAAYSGGGGARLMDWQQGLAQTDKNAVTRSVQDTELTSKQLSRLLDENGRYIQSARLRAREGAAAGGMLMSTLAAGAAERSAIDAALPIAQGDANTFFQTSSENMRVQNEDVQADQGAGRNLFGQTMSLDAQMQEAEAGRQFTSGENAVTRGFQAEQAGMDRALTIDQNERQRQVQLLMQERGISADMARQIVDQQFTSGENRLTREQNATLESNRLAQGRFDSYVNMQANREGQLNQIISSIYSNPNLSATQQQAAVQNARAVFASLTTGTNAALSAGVPQIFATPFVMQPGQPAPGATPTQPTTPAPTTGLQPGFTPIPGTDLASGPGGVIRRAIDVALARG